MADDTDLNLDDLEEDEVKATDSKEEDIEEVFAEDEQTEITSRELEAVYDIPVQVSAVLGKQTMQVSQLLKLLNQLHPYPSQNHQKMQFQVLFQENVEQH